jgi:hypothetical protein
VAAEEAAWGDYVKYWQRRLGELEAAEQGGAGAGPRPQPPLEWKAYRVMHVRFSGARACQKQVTGALWKDARLEEASRKWLGGMREPYVSENMGVKPKGSDKVFYVDQFAVDQATLGPGATPRVYTFSVKQRDFTGWDADRIERQILKDVEEALAKYGGTLEVRRKGHPLYGREVTVARVHVIYDAKTAPADMGALDDVLKEARNRGVEVHFHDPR